MRFQKQGSQASLFLIGWNAICLAVPLWLYLQPSPEPTIARAVVLVFFAGPAAILALIVNLMTIFIKRSLIGIVLTVITAAIVGTWLVAILRS
ncbi:hypothetical protein PZ895_11315 [Mesorhizobium sp. YIM 152430]|uniref:hypothetical protein n=1 Tax=Mesorhizobium sp. YIM 152430 TaxID=3031761 RepID=UPI0023DA543F|nr:hypothetical protein [Mesorhizobium sp. YIM 152430]MDF1600349.1 hypothetical protein [Mesorhizobium sp. YIM 152430]